MSKKSNSLEGLVADRTVGSDVVQSDFSCVTGRVLTLGDVHGAGAISDVLTSLKEDDRLVLVGDLMDRGPQTIDFMLRLIEDNGCKIVAVRGNHEEMFLQYVRSRAASDKSSLSDRAFIKEIFQQNLTRQNAYSKLTAAGVKQDEVNFLWNGGLWAEDVELEQLQAMAAYVDALPYIRQVLLKDNQQFLVCHADMSMLDDQDVSKLLRREKTLSVAEKAALTWARKVGDEVSYASYNQARGSSSQRVYVGHEITTKPGVEVVRRDTNHVNLDFGAYIGLPLVGIEHPNKVVVMGELRENISGEGKKRYFSQLVTLHATIGNIEFSSETVFNSYLEYVQQKKFRVLEANLLAVAPLPETDSDRQSHKLDAGTFQRDLSKGGLNQEQLYQVMQSMRVGFTSDAARYETARRDDETSVFFTLHEKAVPSMPDVSPRRVINIAGTLNALDRVGPAQHHVDSTDFARVLADIAKMNTAVDCIQMPLAAGNGRYNFLHLQIFKQEDGIGARIIDSTINHPFATVPDDFVKKVLADNANSLQSILGAERAHVYPVSVARTNEQMLPTDKKCPFYVAKGIEAATQAILSTGPHLLTQDVWAKNTVRHAHHVVSKTDEMALVFQLAQTKTISDDVPTETDAASHAERVAFPVMQDDRTQEEGSNPAPADTLDQALLSELYTGDDVIHDAKKPSVALDPHRKVEDILNALTQHHELNTLSTVVVQALEQYLEDRKGVRTSFFRQFSDAGKDYAADAIARIRRDSSAAASVTREILHMGLQKDGQLEVKHNSRLDHVLKAFAKKGLIKQLPAAGVMGIKINMGEVSVSEGQKEVTHHSSSSLFTNG